MSARREDVAGKQTVPVRSGGVVDDLRSEINRLFDRLSGESAWAPARSGEPFAGIDRPALWSGETALGTADLSETDEGYELQIDLPGMKKEDLSVELSDGVLTVAGERSDEREEERKGYFLSERSYGAVRRSFPVPDSVRSDAIEAEFKDGVLTLKLPRTDEAKRNARRIEVS